MNAQHWCDGIISNTDDTTHAATRDSVRNATSVEYDVQKRGIGIDKAKKRMCRKSGERGEPQSLAFSQSIPGRLMRTKGEKEVYCAQTRPPDVM